MSHNITYSESEHSYIKFSAVSSIVLKPLYSTQAQNNTAVSEGAMKPVNSFLYQNSFGGKTLQKYVNVLRLPALSTELGGNVEENITGGVACRFHGVLHNTDYEAYCNGLHGNVVVNAKHGTCHRDE